VVVVVLVPLLQFEMQQTGKHKNGSRKKSHYPPRMKIIIIIENFDQGYTTQTADKIDYNTTY